MSDAAVGGVSGAVTSPARPSWRRVFAVAEFRGQFGAQALSVVGDQLAKIAIAILVFRDTRSPFLAALVYAASLLPALVAGPLLGHLADTRRRRELMIVCDVGRAALVAAMLVPGVPIAGLIGLLFAASTFDAPFFAARAAILPEILPSDLYALGQSINGVMSQTAQVLGFGVGGVFVALLSARGALALDVATFLLSAVVVRVTIASRPAPASAGDLGRWELVSSGTLTVMRDPMLRRLIGVTAACFGTIIATEGMAVSYAHEIGHGDVATGLLAAAAPVGSVMGLVLVGRIPPARQIMAMRVLAVLWPLPLLGTLLRPSIPVTIVLWAAAGALSAFQLIGNVLFAQALDGPSRGRAFAFAQSALVAVQGLGLLGAGIVADLASPSVAVGAAGLLGLVLCGALSFRLREAPSSTETASLSPATSGSVENRRVGDVTSTSPEATGSRDRSPSGVRDAAASHGGLAPALRRVGVYTLSALVLAASVFLVFRTGWKPVTRPPVTIPWWILVLLFGATTHFKIYYQRGRDAQAVLVVQVPLLIGLFFADPRSLLIGALLGPALVDVASRRAQPMKLIANLASSALTVLISLAIFRDLGVVDDHGAATRNLLAGLAAVVCAELGSMLFIFSVRTFYQPGVDVRLFLRPAAAALVVAVAAGFLGLIAVTAMFANATSAALLIVVAVLAAAGFKSYANLQQRHKDLGRLYEFQETLGALVPSGTSMFPVLEHARDLLHAESVSLYLHPQAVVPGRVHEVRVHVDQAPQEQVHATDATDMQGAPPVAMAVDLRLGGRELGRLVVRNRLGQVRGFDAGDLRLLETLGAQVSDALERGTLLEQLQIAATHDSLTGLLTLGEFLGRLDDGLIRGTPFVVALLDVAGLKEVNGSLGHDAGDALLRTLGERLTAWAAPGSLLARSGGGEFAVAAPVEAGRGEATVEAVARVGNALVQVLGVTVELRTRIGWLELPADAADGATAVRRADLALAAAKNDSMRSVRYTPEMDVDGFRRLRLVTDLREAVAARRLTVVYQPLVRPSDGVLIGAEALVRWKHDEYGQLSPDEFVPIAEHSGLIADLTRFVLDAALAQTRRWHDAGRPLRISVNLSARCLSDLALPGDVVDLMARHRVSPDFVTLEVTETSVAEDPVRALAVLQRLRAIGVRLSIDDFGTGYSSLASLKRFPVQEVKLDRQFLAEMDSAGETGDVSLLPAVIALGHSLDLEIVAEGVETLAAYEKLRLLGVDVLQGFYIGKPGPGSRLLNDTIETKLGRAPSVEGKKPGTVSRASRRTSATTG